MIRGFNMRRAHEPYLTRVDNNKLCAFTQAALHLRGKHRVAGGRVGANDHDDIGIHHTVERLRTGRRSQRGLESIARRRVAHACTGIDVVIAHGGAHQFLYDVHFFIRAT